MSDIMYSDSLEGVTPERLKGFFVGWPKKPSSETHFILLQKSSHCIIGSNEQGDIVGFITAITDGILSSYIPFLEVLPEYQGKGIGTELVKRILEKLKDLYMVDLLCDQELQGFYEQLGMQKAVGMMLRNFDKQAGE